MGITGKRGRKARGERRGGGKIVEEREEMMGSGRDWGEGGKGDVEERERR